MTNETTPTPWAYSGEDKEIFYDDGDVRPRIAIIDDNTSPAQQAADGALICRAVNSHAALIAIAKRAQSFTGDYIDHAETWEMCAVAELDADLCAALALAREG